MSARVTKEELASKRLGDLLRSEYERWEQIFTHGCSDPFWEDGCNLNLVRNHVLWYRGLIETQMDQAQFPECYFWEIPPVVPPKYMADADGIRRDAKKTIDIVSKHPDFAYLKNYQAAHRMNGEKSKKLSPVAYVRYLMEAIEADDLLHMRRYRKPEYLLTQITESRKALEQMEQEERVLPMGQLSIFDFI